MNLRFDIYTGMDELDLDHIDVDYLVSILLDAKAKNPELKLFLEVDSGYSSGELNLYGEREETPEETKKRLNTQKEQAKAKLDRILRDKTSLENELKQIEQHKRHECNSYPMKIVMGKWRPIPGNRCAQTAHMYWVYFCDKCYKFHINFSYDHRITGTVPVEYRNTKATLLLSAQDYIYNLLKEMGDDLYVAPQNEECGSN